MTNTPKIIVSVLVVSIGLALFFSLRSRAKTKKVAIVQKSFFDQLDDDRIVQLKIETDFSTLIKNRDELLEQPAHLQVELEPGSFQAYPIKVSLRGKTRRGLCNFPPLKLNLNKTDLAEKGLKSFDKYKLVTHCIEDSELVLKEYLAYKLYSQLTEYSFRTHLVDLVYIDQGKSLDTLHQYGILLENYGELAERFGAQKMPDQLPKNTKIPNEDYQRLALFQYMIGNTDWNLYRQHNIKWLARKDGAIPVPYDFDFSGLVNAPYASPHPSLPIDSVRQRFLQWRGGDQAQLEEMRKKLHQKQQEIIQTCKQFAQLSPNEKADMTTYLEEYFSVQPTEILD